ncbi:MAG: polymorphic toxin type 50 domain-containing protein [Chlamydiales bacterium]|nr:polymorphic toxin type 50 domain-containing protein [Chlamydiales bacterium]
MNGWQDVATQFNVMYSNCIHEHRHLYSYYDRGRLHYDQGEHHECVQDMVAFIEGGGPNELLEESKAMLGTALSEVGEYDKAIITLSEAIQKDPNAKDLYYQRAVAYFETGNFDDALEDFLNSDKLSAVSQTSNNSPIFASGLLDGLVEGGYDSVADLFPCLWNSVRGISTCLWTCCQEPLHSYNQFVDASAEVAGFVVEHLRSLDKNTLKECTKECKRLIKSFEALPDYERGRQIGYILGKFGTDIYAGSAAIKAVAAYQKLREANRLLIFETMTVSNANKERIVVAATEHCTKRSEYFKTVKLEWDKQNKHIVGSRRYEGGFRSIFTHKDPERLLKDFAGTGRPANKRIPGTPGYRETVDFQEFIGYHVEEITGVKTRTTVGTIHYSKKGAHIVPARPIN